MKLTVAFAALLLPGAALAEDSLPAPQGLPLPVALGGAFDLIDHNGEPRTQENPDGHIQLLFFGYANCPAICTVALPLMADVTADLAEQGLSVTPVMITIDPSRDTLETLGPDLADYSPDLVGLTGTPEALQVAYDAYQIEIEEAFVDPEYGPIYAHGSFVYVLDADGTFLTVLPPILSTDRVSEIVATYAAQGS